MDLQARAELLARLLGERLDVSGDGFEARLNRAGRRLPRAIRADAALIVEALHRQAHPKLARQTDPRRLARALRNVERYLRQVDPWARRRALVLDWLAGNALGLLLMLALAGAVIAWRGLL